MYTDGDSLQYIDRNTAESYLSVRSYPSALSKKVSFIAFAYYEIKMLFLKLQFITISSQIALS